MPLCGNAGVSSIGRQTAHAPFCRHPRHAAGNCFNKRDAPTSGTSGGTPQRRAPKAEDEAQPAPAPTRASAGAGVLWRILRMSLRHRWLLLIGSLAVVGAAGFQLWIPRLLGESVDHAHALLSGAAVDAGEARSALVRSAILILLASVLRGSFAFVQQYLGETLSHKVAYTLRLAFFEKLQRLSFGFHATAHTGNLMSRGIVDIEGVRMFVTTGVLRVLHLGLLIGIGTYLLLDLNFRLGLISLAFVPVVGALAIITRLKLRAIWLHIQEAYGALTTVLQENLSGVRVVRAFAAQHHEERRFDRSSRVVTALRLDAIGVHARNTSMMTFAFLVTWAAILWYGGAQVIAGTMTVGQLTQFLAYLGLLQMPVRMLGMMVNSFARASSCGARLFEILDQAPTIADKPDARPLEAPRGVVRFENVSFGYHDEFGDTPALENISFEARPGRVLGLVGPPGCGKTTIAQLIPRFYDVTDGRITIDGQDLRDVTLESLRKTVALVQQDAFMFKTTMHDNVAYGRPDAEQDSIEDVSRLAQFHEYAASLPEGYETVVGERGNSLSGGQRQRLAIARSLLMDPAVIVFDDSTASIDAATEERIRRALADITKNKTKIIISHRLSSLMHADEILVLDKGRVAERGTHEELIAAGGRYRDLYELQIRPALDGNGREGLQTVPLKTGS